MKDDKIVIRIEKAIKTQLQKLADSESGSLSNYLNMMLLDRVKSKK